MADTDPRRLSTILRYAKEYGLTSLEFEDGDFKVRANFGAVQEAQKAPAKQPTRLELELAAKKRLQEVRPALESFSEKPPFFDFGLKANSGS